MKRKIIIIGGCGYAINAAEIRQHLETAGVDMTEVEIIDALTPTDIGDGTAVMARGAKLEVMNMAIRAVPDPVDIKELPRREIQPRFKFQNVRNIRK